MPLLTISYEARGGVGYRAVVAPGNDRTDAARGAASCRPAATSCSATLLQTGHGVDAVELAACSAGGVLDAGNAVAARPCQF